MFSTVGVGAAEDGDGGGMVVDDLLGAHVTSSRATSRSSSFGMLVDGVSSTILLGNTDRGGERNNPGKAQPRRAPPAPACPPPQDPAPPGGDQRASHGV